jgi:hypothetical protein
VFKIYAYLAKRPDITTEAFIDHYEHRHIPLVLSLAPMPRVYKRNYLVREDPANRDVSALGFDVVTELAWDDRAGFADWVSRLGVAAVAEDEARFLDRSRTRACVIDERVSVVSAGAGGADDVGGPAMGRADDTPSSRRGVGS